MDIEAMIERVAVLGELDGGASPVWLRKNSTVQVWGRQRVVWNAQWTEEEEAFVRQNMGRMTDEEIGEALGRSACAVKIRRVRRQMGSPSKQDGVLTGNGVAKALGVDIHSIMRMHETGRMQFQRMAGERGILLISEVQLSLWAIRPENWVCFRVEKMGDRKLARLVELAQAKWTDEWWSVGQVARHHGVDIRLVTKHIWKGWLPAQRWGNHYALRSVVVNYPRFITGKGYGWRENQQWPAGADEFMLRASAEGHSIAEIARMMKWNPKRTAYRLRVLKKYQNGIESMEEA